MANQFDLKKFLNENKLTRASRALNENKISRKKMLKEYIDADPETIAQAFAKAGIDPSAETYMMRADSTGPGGSQGELERVDNVQGLIVKLETEREEANQSDNGVVYDYDANEAYPEEGMDAKLSIMFGDDYEYVIYQAVANRAIAEGDSFDYSNLILSTINSLTDMGEEGQNALRVLEKISDWNEVVRLATEE
jgi:hypothetical protein